MTTIYLNPGPLTSFNSLTYNLGPQLDNIRDLYVHGSTPEVVLDLRHLNQGFLNVATLASLLSICHRLSKFFGAPIQTEFSLNPYVQRFLNHVDFFQIAKRLKILTWDDRTVGGFWPSNMNPNTKILYFGDVFHGISDCSPEEIIHIKAKHKQKIGPNFSLRCAEIFKGFEPHLQNTIENTALELITNCLIHAKDVAFVGIARTSARISVSVCDSGIGFKRSLSYSYPTSEIFQKANNIQSLVIGSLIQKHEHGLRLAINHVLNYNEYPIDYTNEGWVIISSFDSEIRWQKENWNKAIEYYQENSLTSVLPDISQILGEDVKRKMEYNDVEKGYWKNYAKHLVGTRITFEIPLI